MTTDKALRKLKTALRRLSPIQGEIARRNARRAVSAAIATIRRTVDAEFPAPPRKVRATSRDPNAVARRQVKRGWSEERDTIKIATAALVGISVRTAGGKTWLPDWTTVIDSKDWKRAARDLKFRRALLVHDALVNM